MPNNDPIQAGQQTSIPTSNYDVNKDLGKVIDGLGTVNAPAAPNLLLDSTMEGNGETNPLYAQYLAMLQGAKKNPLSTPVYTNYAKTERYSNDKLGGYNPYDINQENWYANNQGWFSQMGNRFAKLGTKALGSFANSLMDIPNVINATANGDIDKMWDNPTNTWATDLMDWSEKHFPNYKTSWETAHPFLNLIPFYGHAGNGWGNVLEQTGFTVGAIGGAVAEDFLVGAVTEGIGEIPLAAAQINKAIYNLGKLVNAGDEALSGLKTSIRSADDIVKGLKGIDRFNYAVRKGLWGANMITSGISEAAFEGIESYRTLSSDLTKQYYEQNGKLPDYQESQKIEQSGRSAANARFILNTGLLAMTNSIQWGNLLRPLNATKSLLEAEAKQGVEVALKAGSKDLFEAVENTSRLAKIGRAVKNNAVVSAITESGSEGFEEGAQYVIETGVNDYYKRKYDSDAIGKTNNFLKSFGYGLSQALGTQEGWENIVYGLLGGAMYKAGEHIYYKVRGVETTPDYKKEIGNVIAGLNSKSLSGIFENKYSEAVAAQSIQDDLQEAAKSGNTFLYKNYKHEQFVDFVLSGIQQNKFETRLAQLQELKKLDDEEFKKTFGIPATDENRKTASEYVSKMEENANYINDVNKRVSRTFVNPFKYKGTGNYKNKEEQINQDEENEKHRVFEQAKHELVYNMSVSKDSTDRINAVRQHISSLQSVVSPEDVIKLSSSGGLLELKKDYTDKLKDLEDSLKLNKDAKTEKEANWYRSKIEDIRNISNEKSEEKANVIYNKFLGEVFDKYQRNRGSFYESYGTDAQKKSTAAPFPRDIINEAIGFGKDITYLQKRNEFAIDRYAHLTTKGGFRRLFDNIKEERTKAQDLEVALKEESKPTQPVVTTPVEQTQPIQAEPKPTAKELAKGTPPIQGTVEDRKTLASTEQATRYNRIAQDVLDGKVTYDELSLEGLGFQRKGDILFESPQANLTKDYVKIKTLSGDEMYMSNEKAANVRLIANKGVSDVIEKKEGEVPIPINPLTNPAAPKGKTPLRTEDYTAKIFVPEDLKQVFNNAIFSGTKEQVRQDLSITVRALSPEFQSQYDAQRAQGNFTEVKGFPGVFVAKAPIDLSISHKGIEIGKIAYPERLLFRVGNQLVTIDRVSPEQYQLLTGRSAAQWVADVEDYTKQLAFKNYLALRYKNNNLQPTTLSAEEIKDLVDVNITYGEYDLVTADAQRPLFSDLKRKTVTFPTKDGGVAEGMVVLSIPKQYVGDTYERARTTFMNVLYSQNVYDNPAIDTTKVTQLTRQNVDELLRIGTRYIALVEQPDGRLRPIALRPKAMEDTARAELFNTIKQRAELAFTTNFKEGTKESHDGVLLLGDKELYYKLPTDKSKEFNDEFNTVLNNSAFISDKNGKCYFNISVSPIGAARLEVVRPHPATPYRTTLYIAPQKLAGIINFGDFVKALNNEIAKKAKADPVFAELKIELSVSNFRQNIANDDDIKNVEQISSEVSVATTTEVFKNGTMRLSPNIGNVLEAYKKAGSYETAQAAPEEQPSQQAPTTFFGQSMSDQEVRESQQSSPFGEGTFLVPGSEEGLTQPAQGVGIESPRERTIANQEDLSNVEFDSVKDALAAFDIGYRFRADNTLEFYNISSGQIIDLPGVSPTDLADQMNLKIKKQEKPKGDEGFDFKRAEGNPTLENLINFEKAKEELSKILPSFISVDDLNTIVDALKEQGIENPTGSVWGAFKNNILYLNKRAPNIGVEYHEAFHAVFNTVMGSQERDLLSERGKEGLYTDLKKEGKSILQHISDQRKEGVWKDLSNAQAVNKASEEWLAEKYRTWRNKKSDAGFFQKLFDLIEKFFRWILRNEDLLDATFRKIDRGAYKYSNVAANSFLQETNDLFSTPEFKLMSIPTRPGILQVGNAELPIKRNLDAKTSKQVIQRVASYFTIYKETGRFENITDDKVLENILNDLHRTYSKDNPEYATKSEAELQEILNSDEAYIYSNEDSRRIIKEGAKEYINTIRYVEQFREDELEENEQDTGSPSSGYDNSSENIGGFSSLPGMLRQYIGFTFYEQEDKFGNVSLANGEQDPSKRINTIATVDSLSVYYGLLRTLANITDPIRFFQKMIAYADNNEQSRHFVEKFIKDTGLSKEELDEGRIEATKNKNLVELVRKGFNKFRIDYIFTEHDVKKSTTESYEANRRNVENIQFDKWANTFIAEYAKLSQGHQKYIQVGIDDIRNKYFDERRVQKMSSEELRNAVLDVRHNLRNVGIQVSHDYIKYSLLSIAAKKYENLVKESTKTGHIINFDSPENKFITEQDYKYVQIMKIADEISLNKEFVDELSKTLAREDNPFFKEVRNVSKEVDNYGTTEIEEERLIDTAMIGRLLNLGKGNAFFDETVGESSYTNAEGKVVFAHQDGTFNVKFSYQLRDAEFRKRLRETGTRDDVNAIIDSYDSEWLTNNYLLRSDDFEAVADNLLFQNIDGMRAVETNSIGRVITQEFRDQKDGVTYGEFSPREFIVNLMNLYVSYSKVQRTSKGNIMTAPHLIRVLEASKTANTVNLPIITDIYRGGKPTDKTANILFENVRKEFNRIQRVSGEIDTLKENVVENYHTGSFNEDGSIKSGYRGLQFTDNITSIVTKSTLARLESKARKGEPMTEQEIVEIKNEIKDHVDRMVHDTIEVMRKEGIITESNKDYGNVLLFSGVDRAGRTRGFFAGDDTLNLKNVRTKNDFTDNIGQVVVNDYINTVFYNHILHGDSALSLKNDGGIDAVKRAKGDNAAITSIRTDLTDESLGITQPFTHSVIATFKEPKADTEMAKGVKIADAQMYATVNALRNTLWGLGRLTPRLARVLDALEKGENIHKLVSNDKTYDGVFDKNNGILRWDEMTNSLKLVHKDWKSYFKMSVVVLQPELTSYRDERGDWIARPGWETLHNLRTKMEKDGIHFAAPESASKMMTLDVSKEKDFSDLKGHLFDNTYFGLQTANPSNKLEITTPTQLLQLIDSEQDDSVDVFFQGKNISVKELKDAYQTAVSQKVNNAYSLAKREVYEIQDFNQDIEKSISEGKVTPRLAKFQARALETLEASGSDAQLLDFFSLDEDGQPKFNLNLSATKAKFQQLYLSYFSKGILSQKSPGYTVALFSGIDTKTLRRAKRVENGTVVEWEHIRRAAWDANHRGIRGEQVLPSRGHVTQAGQVYLDELQYNVPKYNDKGEIIGHYSEMMLPAHFKEFLTIHPGDQIPEAISRMLGVRIPSQDKHSFMSMELVDFLPANLGSTGMFPKELIALSGADFDIDKEYISRYDFYMNRDANGRPTFHKYGDAKTDEGKWQEYKHWMSKNSKPIKNAIKDLLENDPRYINLKEEGQLIEDQQAIDEMSTKRKNLLDELYLETVPKALAQFNLPDSLEKFVEASKTKELNNGVLTNRIVDAYIALLTNKGMQDIAKTPATLTYLENVQHEDDILLKDAEGKVLGSVFEKKTNYPVDSLIGKYNAFKNNTTGKNNIGIDVNVNLIYSVLNKGGVKLTNAENNGIIFDGQLFSSFTGDNEYNPKTKSFDGRRTNDVLSTLISSATDEAKEQLNALYGLSVDALKVVGYMVSIKVPLKTAIYFVNQPSIRNYLDLKAVKQNTLQTTSEERLYKDVFRESALLKLESDIKNYQQSSVNEIFNMFEREGLIEVKCD